MAGATMRPVSSAEYLEAITQMNLREKDIEEIRACTGLPPVQALALSVNDSQFVNVIELNGKIEGVWGLFIAHNFGMPWFVCTDRLFESLRTRIRFTKRSREVVTWMKDQVPFLANYVMASHHNAIEWLEWLGFTVDKETEYFLHDPEVPFYLFTMEGN